MDHELLPRLLYLLLLGGAVAGWLVMQNRRRLGQMAQQAAIWTFIFIGAIVAVGLWDDVRRAAGPPRATVLDDGRIELPRALDGHFYLTAEVNGTPLRFMIDTGATSIVLSGPDARAAGIDTGSLSYLGEAYTANGRVRTARVELDRLAVGGVTDRGVMAWVNSGDMDTSLLGMTYLDRFARIEITSDRMLLAR